MIGPDTDPRVVTFGARMFWPRVLLRPGCWLWDGATGATGYGQMSGRIDGKPRTIQAHRVAYEIMVGPVPDGLELDHLCRNRECVNPAHLEAVPHLLNCLRSFPVGDPDGAVWSLAAVGYRPMDRAS